LKLVPDTNVSVSALLKRSSVPGQILQAWWDARFDLLISDPLYAELADVLNRRKLRAYLEPELSQRFLELLRDYATWVEAAQAPERALRDPKDTMVLGTAVSGRANLIVSGDQDLLALRRFQSIPILEPRAALKMIRGR